MSFIRTSRHLLHPDSGMTHSVASEITPRAVYEGRRLWLQDAAGIGGLAAVSLAGGLLGLPAHAQGAAAVKRPGKLAALAGARSGVANAYAMEKLTPYEDVTTYNNYYEFGTDKSDPAENAHTLKTRPWTVRWRTRST